MYNEKDEIKLFSELNLAMELDENKNYDLVDCQLDIEKGLDFCITTTYPDGLPDNLGVMFFSVDPSFRVNVQETNRCASVGERMFEINLKKL